MRAPLRFATRNLLFPRRDECWALYLLDPDSVGGHTTTDQLRLLARMAGLFATLEADFTLHRVTRTWDASTYRDHARLQIDERHAHPQLWDEHLAEHQARLGGRPVLEPQTWLAVRLDHAATPARNGLGWRQLLGRDDPLLISEQRLAELAQLEDRTHQRVDSHAACRRATTTDVQWLLRRQLTRGLPEPALDPHWAPQALTILNPDDHLRYEPLELDILRLHDAPITLHERSVVVSSEAGESHQAHLVLGALPETVPFPDPRAELLFAPLEGLGLPIDATVSVRVLANDRATTLVRRKVIDADHEHHEQSHGDHGPSPEAARRPTLARELEDYLTSDGRPPLLKTTIVLAVGATTAEQLEERVDAVRRAYAPVRLHRPLGSQLALFAEHTPAAGTQAGEYADVLTVEQLAAMLPTATTNTGSTHGPLIGFTASGSRRPVLLDLTEAARTSRPPATLLAGTLGSGKTMTLQLLLYQAFLRGSRIVDIDPKGDHHLDQLPGMHGHVETIELTADPRFRGLLDPLRIAPPATREDLASSFLVSVLPAPIPAPWRTAIRAAVKQVALTDDPTCGAVIEMLTSATDDTRHAGTALAVYADTGLAQLGFAQPGSQPPPAGSAQVTSLRVRNLPRPVPGTPLTDLTEEERLGTAVLHLLATYAMHLMGDDRSRHKVLGLDEAWFLLADSAGRRLIEHLNRWGRSENATPLLVTHLAADATDLDGLIGTRLIFGQASEPEAIAALQLLRLDPEDEHHTRRLLGYRRGRCLMRDLEGRVAEVQIDPGPALLAALDTTPGRQPPLQGMS